MNWKERAKALFFVEKMNLTKISEKIGISRQSISKYLNSQPDYKKEKENRKINNQKKQQECKKQWNRVNYYGEHHRYSTINSETLKHEHDLATYILSKEKY